MKKYLGKGVYGAVAIGKISVFKKCDAAVTRTHVEDTEKEKQRVKAAKELAAKQLTEIHEKALREVGETHAQIFEIHLMMLDDDDYNESIENIIDTQSVNAEYAVALTSDNFAGMFSSMDDAYMQARAADVRDISNRIIANLTGAIPTAPQPMRSLSSVRTILHRAKPFRLIRTRCLHSLPLTARQIPIRQFLQEI